MSLSELLNPVDKNVMYDGRDEKQILQAVLEQQEAEENREKNDGDISNDDNPTTIIREKPAHRDALQAVSMLWDYVADMDESFAHEFEAMLNKFGCQTCLDEFLLQPSAITDYFGSKSL
ncbi:hypothetical protein C0993_004284 [Termitomyces sp. T159_Od127]|nr:hypothetical protein C0993_004284 [Termitomyces sp. T159_Od127]